MGATSRRQHHLLDRGLQFISAGFERQGGDGRDRRCVATHSGTGGRGGVDGESSICGVYDSFKGVGFWKAEF